MQSLSGAIRNFGPLAQLSGRDRALRVVLKQNDCTDEGLAVHEFDVWLCSGMAWRLRGQA